MPSLKGQPSHAQRGENDMIWHETEDQAPARWAQWDALSRRPHLVPAHGDAMSSKCIMEKMTDELRVPLIITHGPWSTMSCNLRVLFSFSSLVFDCLTICKVFILSKMKGTDIYSLKGEKQRTEKLSAPISTVKTLKWITRINLLTIAWPAGAPLSICKKERYGSCKPLPAGPEQTISLNLGTCSLSLLISVMPFQHILWKSLSCAQLLERKQKSQRRKDMQKSE